MNEVTKDMIILDALNAEPDIAPFFIEIGMHCLGCPSATGETIAEACEVHGADADELIDRINEFIRNK